MAANPPKRSTHAAPKPPFTPTPEQIADRCEAIRDSWPDLECRRRAGAAGYEPWTPPVVNVDEIERPNE